MDNNTLFILAFYLIACVIVAIEADSRGHGFGKGFFYSVFTSPLIGAILIAPYKPTIAGSTEAVKYLEEVPESNEVTQLKKKYAAGTITFDQYTEEFNKINLK